MLDGMKTIRAREALPRLAADFLMIQGAGLAALNGVLLVRMEPATAAEAAHFAAIFRHYYFSAFLPLSLTFPVVFLLSGLYTSCRHYAKPYKWQKVLRSTLLATLVFLFANFLFTRASELPRSTAVVFAVLSVCGTVGARWLKHSLFDSELDRVAAEAGQATECVLVVGGAGYIGSELARRLLASGRRVRVLDSLVYGDGAIRDLITDPHFELMVGDCRNIQDMVAAVKGAASIVHLAAIVGDPACEQDHRSALEINYAATRMMLEIARGHGIRKFIFASSCSVYGASEHVMNENSEVQPISLYGQTKVDSERALLAAAGDGFYPTVLRFSTVFGISYRPRFDLVVNLLTAKACREGVITIFNGDQWRPFIHVRDVAEALMRVLEAPAALTSGEIFNVGDSRMNYTLAAIADKIRAEFPQTRVERVENLDRRNYRVSFDKIRSLLGFESTLTIEDGIRELKQALESGQVDDYTDCRYNNQKFLAMTGSPAYKDEIDGRVMAAFATALLDAGTNAARQSAG
jgi:nucleoside-diphosphate-sugar epimerase